RVKLTVLYGGLFFLAGAILLTAMFLLVRQTLGDRLGPKVRISQVGGDAPRIGTATGSFQLPDGRTVGPSEAAYYVAKQQNDAVSGTLNALLVEGGIALGVVGAVAVGFGWLMAERTLRPVHEITATARRVAGAASAHRGLHERIALTGPRDEIT